MQRLIIAGMAVFVLALGVLAVDWDSFTTRVQPAAAGPTSIEVSKTGDYDGRFVSGTISITNVDEYTAVIGAIADHLEVHFPPQR